MIQIAVQVRASNVREVLHEAETYVVNKDQVRAPDAGDSRNCGRHKDERQAGEQDHACDDHHDRQDSIIHRFDLQEEAPDCEDHQTGSIPLRPEREVVLLQQSVPMKEGAHSESIPSAASVSGRFRLLGQIVSLHQGCSTTSWDVYEQQIIAWFHRGGRR